MSPDRDLGRLGDDGSDLDEYGEAPRSIFSALWFRALLAVLILGILAAVAVPYVLDFATTRAVKTPAKLASMAQPTAATPPSAAAPAATVATAFPAAPASTAAAPAASSAAQATASPAPAPETAKPKLAPVAVAKPPAKAEKSAADTPKQAPKASATKPSSAKAATVAATGGSYWVQIGAFKEPETAKRLVARLREQGLHAEASTTSTVAPRSPTEPPSGGSSIDRYHVVVSGASASDVDAKLAAKGLTSETTPNGIVVRPSLALREAVALSRDLADAGLSVQVRRVGGPAPVAATPPAAGVTLHRVRVGGFPDRATAVAASKQLEEKGFKPFIARGNE